MTSDPRRPDLRGLFAPRSIAIIGASDRNVFSALAASCLKAVDYQGQVFGVNREGKVAHGYPGYTSCVAIGQPVDCAYIGVPSAAVIPAIAEAAQAGIRNFVVVSGGFAETGAAGLEAQAELQALARREGLNILGPNCLGYFNLVARTSVGALTATDLPRPGSVALISASGAMASQVLRFCERQGIGISHAIATGNEAVLGAAEILAYLVEDPDVRAIGLFLEEIRNPDLFAQAAEAARRARKPIVVLKVGASPCAAKVASAHTGAVTGDDAAFDALCDRLAMIRVRGFEELAVTAALIAATGPLSGKGAAFISMSGGACELVADLAGAAGLDLPDFSPATRAKLEALIAAGGLAQVHNPLDLTGAVARDTATWGKILDAIAEDGFGAIIAQTEQPSEWERTPTIEAVMADIATGLRRHAPRALMMGTIGVPLKDYDRDFLRDAGGGLIVPGASVGVPALANALRWSRMVAG